MDDPLDFEVEDDLLAPLPINNKRYSYSNLSIFDFYQFSPLLGLGFYNFVSIFQLVC